MVDRHDIKVHDYLLFLLDRLTEQFGSLDNGLVTVESHQNFDDTVASLLAELSARNFRIPLTIDFDTRLDRHGKRRLPTLIIFGNPMVGTPLMLANQQIGVDLPQKFLVWQGKERQVNITYNDPFFIAARHAIQGQEGRLTAIAAALASIAGVGADTGLLSLRTRKRRRPLRLLAIRLSPSRHSGQTKLFIDVS